MPKQIQNKNLTPQIAVVFAALVSLFGNALQAAVLPEDRTDILYHSFDGGGVTITGPSVLVRKEFADTVSLWGNYYVDMVTSASIDVVTQGSPYTEERLEQSAGIDYLHDKTTMSLSYTSSVENDYEAETVGFSVSQDFFGDLSTLSLAYSQGNDIVMENGTPDFRDTAEHQRFSINFSQIITKSWILAFGAESVIDQGYLNNPYRSVRYLRADGESTASQSEIYPRTHNSDAFAIRSMYYLPYRAALKVELRTYADSWGIKANNAEIRYIHPYQDAWVFEGKIRSYSQTAADFYSDLFPFENAQSFLASDKELSQYSNIAFGLGFSFVINSPYLSFFDKTQLNFFWDNMRFTYDNFRDRRLSRSLNDDPAQFLPGNEPNYTLNANVLRLFLTLTY